MTTRTIDCTAIQIGDRVEIATNDPRFIGRVGEVKWLSGDRVGINFDPEGTFALRLGAITRHLKQTAEPEYTGGSVSYYSVSISNPTTQPTPYTAECNDIIEALGMNYAEGNAFKAIWRSCAARALGKAKRGYTDALYDAEKVVFFGERMVAMAKAKKS